MYTIAHLLTSIEWHTELVHLDSPCVVSEKYDFYQELALQIKSALIGSHKSNPSVKIIMPCDKHVFCEGLGSLGYVYVYKSTKHLT